MRVRVWGGDAVLGKVAQAMCSPQLLQELSGSHAQPTYTPSATKQLFLRVVASSVIRLTVESADKVRGSPPPPPTPPSCGREE